MPAERISVRSRRMVVKVQLPIVTNAQPPRALVYSRDRQSIMTEVPVTAALRKAMRGELKAFFYAYMRGTTLHLDGLATWRKW